MEIEILLCDFSSYPNFLGFLPPHNPQALQKSMNLIIYSYRRKLKQQRPIDIPIPIMKGIKMNKTTVWQYFSN